MKALTLMRFLQRTKNRSHQSSRPAAHRQQQIAAAAAAAAAAAEVHAVMYDT